ncbi:hypothetical protein C7M56_04145 [Clostridium botulinum]|uniref:Uncharacterized protein n=1 Tax=Clostridium botulinum TaxID=1491 RepID=A0ABC8CUL3_CLOBO|nr:hypothetical protein C7M56_04145 [Clostridium botulinum]
MKPRMAPRLGRKFLMKPTLELLSKMNWFMSVFFIFAVLKLNLLHFRYRFAYVKYYILFAMNLEVLLPFP